MKRLTLSLFIALAIAAFLPSADLYAQRTSRINRPCSGSSTPAKVEVEADGDIVIVPCSARELIVGASFASQSTKDARLAIDDGSTDYTTALDYTGLFVNARASLTGSFKTVRGLEVTARQTGSGLNPTAYAGQFALTTTGATALVYGQHTRVTTAANASSTTTGHFSNGVQSATVTTGLGLVSEFSANAGGVITNATAGSFAVHTTDTGTIGTSKVLDLSGSGTGVTTSYGIYANSTIDLGTSNRYFIYSLSTSPSFFTGKINYDATVTAGGTTGNRTINKPSGTVNLAAGTATVTVTNSFAATTSIVTAVARTNDSTCAVKNVVPASGSFVINMTANCTAETSVGFIVNN